MFTISPYTTDINVLNAFIKIFGIPLPVFWGIAAVSITVLIMLWWFWRNQRKREQHKLEAKDHVLGEFSDPSGALPVQRVLCEVFKGEVKVVTSKNRAMFATNTYVKIPKNLEGSFIDTYYTLPEHDYKDEWPYQERPSRRIIVTKFYWQLGDPVPKIPHDSRKWDADRYIKITTAMITAAKSEANLQVLVGEFTKYWDQLTDMLKLLKLIKPVMVILVVMCLLLIVDIYFGFQGTKLAGNIMAWLKGMAAAVPK